MAPTRRALLSALPAAAAALAGCSAVDPDDDSLPLSTEWRRSVDQPRQPVRPPDGPLLVGSASPFSDAPLVTALDPATGEERWRVDDRGEGSPVGADAELAYALSKRDEQVVAVEHATGEVRWRADVTPVDEPDPGVVAFAPLVLDDRVVVPVSGVEDDVPDRLVGLSRADGTVRFSHGVPASLSGPPGVADDGVVVPLLDGTLRFVDRDGAERWSLDLGAAMGGVCVAGGTAYVGSARERLHAVDATTGEPRWTSPLRNTVFTRPLVAEETVYVGGADYHVTAVSTRGERRWRAGLPNAITSGPTRLGARLVTLAGGTHRVRGPSGTLPFRPTELAIHHTDGRRLHTQRFEGYLDGGGVGWAVALEEGVYLGQERQVSRLAPEVLADG